MAKKYKPEIEEKRRKRRVLLFSLVMIGLMVFSVVEVILYRGDLSTGQQTKYQGYEFTYKSNPNGQGVLVTKISGQEVEFQNLPPQTGYLDVDSAAVALINNSLQLVLTADMTNLTLQDAMTLDYARLELSLAIPNVVVAQATANDSLKLPVINCSQATPLSPVILFNLSNETSLRADGACLILNAEQADVLRMKDRIIFEYLGILKDGQVTG